MFFRKQSKCLELAKLQCDFLINSLRPYMIITREVWHERGNIAFLTGACVFAVQLEARGSFTDQKVFAVCMVSMEAASGINANFFGEVFERHIRENSDDGSHFRLMVGWGKLFGACSAGLYPFDVGEAGNSAAQACAKRLREEKLPVDAFHIAGLIHDIGWISPNIERFAPDKAHYDFCENAKLSTGFGF